MAKMMLGVFSNRDEAYDAITRLEDRGYNPQDISIVMKDKTEAKELAHDTGAGVVGGAASGATTGAVIGGLAGLVSAIALPGLGAFFIGGPIAAALGLTGAAATTVSGAATGALAGGLIGALTGWGFSDEDAHVYEDRINQGGILVAVPTRVGDDAEVRDILESCGADQIKSATANATRDSRREKEQEMGAPAYYSEVPSRKRTMEDDLEDDLED